MSYLGKEDAAMIITKIAGTEDVNLIQKAYYNSHYGFYGVKVQHMVQADSIMISFVALIQNYNTRVIITSIMFTIVNVMYIINDPTCPIKCVTNKAYPRNKYFRQSFTNCELAAMEPII